MRRRRNSRRAGPAVETALEHEVDSTTIEPEAMRDALCLALSLLDTDKLADLRERLLFNLRRAGLNIGGCLFLLGVPATTSDELTPSDIAQLIRYIRLNGLQSISSPIEGLADLLTIRSTKRSQQSRRAA